MARFEAKYDRLLTVQEAARLLAISPGSLYHWISQGRGPRVTRLSPRCVRFHARDIEQWLDSMAQDGSKRS
jgi:excisionase family DNA binding protein